MNIQGIIFDWAGTTVDFGSLCPVGAFQEAFADHGVTVSSDAVQRFMGRKKVDHLRSILNLPEVSKQWIEQRGSEADSTDITMLYRRVEDLLFETAADFSEPVPHLLEGMEAARRRGLKVGSTTGYTARIMESVVPAAAKHGYSPDAWVASDEVKTGRPWPWMLFRNMEMLDICYPNGIVKVGDTIVDLDEGRNAGAWNVSVVNSSSLVALSLEELNALDEAAREARLGAAREKFVEAGAHYVVADLGELEGVLADIEGRLRAGECPPLPR
jgi:phosphonoacetaldehyde hydrolase